MELNEFVTQTIVDIIKGVKTAQQHEDTAGAIIYPADPFSGDSRLNGNIPNIGLTTDAKTGDSRAVSAIEFDVVVNVTDKSISVSSVAAGVPMVGGGKVQGTEESGESAQTRIRFTIPVAFPVQSDENAEEL